MLLTKLALVMDLFPWLHFRNAVFMVLSAPMMTTDTTSTVPLSEEVEDILNRARKVAAKENSPLLSDRYFLLGILKLNRLFTYSDALLKHAEVSPRRMLSIYRKEKEVFKGIDNAMYETVLEKASQIAKNERTSEEPRVDIEHLLIALLDSPDPLVQSVLTKSQFTRENLVNALPEVKSSNTKRFTLYCIREVLEVVVTVLFLVIVIKQGLGELRLIPSESMLPSLQIGDRVVVEKLSHWTRETQRGDILVFYPPEPEAVLPHDPWGIFLRLTGFSGIIYGKDSRIDTAFIKRVIGLPGDIVEVRPGEGAFINGHLLDEPYVEEVATTCTFVDYCGPIKIPPHMYYMMGDNRNHSADSRYWQFLPEDRIIGRAVFRFFPFDKRMGLLKTPTYSDKQN